MHDQSRQILPYKTGQTEAKQATPMTNSDDSEWRKKNGQILFLDFWIFIDSKLGSSRLKINARANSIHEVLARGSDHPQYLKDVITQSYKRSQCHHLQAPINVNYVLDILGETAFELQGKQCDDLLDIELLEEVAWHIDERYGQSIEVQLTESSPKADVVSLPRAKIKRANSRLL